MIKPGDIFYTSYSDRRHKCKSVRTDCTCNVYNPETARSDIPAPPHMHITGEDTVYPGTSIFNHYHYVGNQLLHVTHGDEIFIENVRTPGAKKVAKGKTAVMGQNTSKVQRTARCEIRCVPEFLEILDYMREHVDGFAGKSRADVLHNILYSTASINLMTGVNCSSEIWSKVDKL